MLISTGKKGLSRRTFLRSSAGVAIALPTLEAMMATPAQAQAASPHRYCVMFGGMSTGRALACGNGGDRLTPATTGANYTLTRPLQALDTHGIKGDVTVITNLLIGWDTGSGIPPGGRSVGWHSSSVQPLLSGRNAFPRGPTSDQVAADVVGSGARFRSLEYKVQASGYRDETSYKRIMSYRADGQPNEPLTSPRLAYESLFTGFTPTDPAEAVAAARALARRRSVIDLVRGNAERLRARLGRADNQRLDRHFDEIRALETRLNAIEPEVEGACHVLDVAAGYQADAPIVMDEYNVDSPDGAYVIGYAQEQERGRLLADLIHMAFVCDLSRVASLMITHAQSFMNVSSILPSGVVSDAHELSHCQGEDFDHEDMVNWHVDHWGYLVKKLKDTPDGDGNLLDRTALALVFEGGNGHDPASNDENSPHSSENMAMLVAGAGMTAGVHINGNQAHPAQGLMACTRAVGATGSFGDFSAPIPGLVG